MRRLALFAAVSIAAVSAYRYQLSARKNPNDFIDAEVVEPTKFPRLPTFFPKKPETGGQESKGGIFGGLAKLLGRDEASIKKREQRQELNTALDRMFEGTGIAGGLMKSMLKGVGGMMSDMLTETANDLQSIQSMVTSYLEDDSNVGSYLGDNIICSAPISSSSSSSSINGRVSKSYAYIMQVQGRNNAGTVQVQATSEGERIVVTQLVFQGVDGRVVTVKGRGGGRGGGRGDYIDVESV